MDPQDDATQLGDVSVGLDADLYNESQIVIKAWDWTTNGYVLLDAVEKGWLGHLSNRVATAVVRTKTGEALHIMAQATE